MNYRSKSQKAQSTKKILSLLFIVILSLSLPSFSVVSATGGPAYWLDVQTLKANDLGVSTFSGLGYMPDSGAFFAMDSGSSELVTFTMRGDLLSSNPSALSATNPLNLTYNPKTDGIYSLSETQGLLEAGTELNGQPSADYQVPLDAYDNAQGITFNPQTGDLYILDAAGPTLVQISASNNEETSSLIQAEQSSLKGLAYNPQDDYLYVYSVDKNYVYAVDENGSIVSSFDFTALNINNFSGITFAPSSDSTDDPANTNLFLADSGTTEMDSQVIELDITAAETPQEVIDASLPSNLVQTINSYLWSPPNTDATGLEYLLTEDKLFISDADVEEAVQKTVEKAHEQEVEAKSAETSNYGDLKSFLVNHIAK